MYHIKSGVRESSPPLPPKKNSNYNNYITKKSINKLSKISICTVDLSVLTAGF